MTNARAAAWYAKRGWAVLPLEPNGKAPIGTLAPHGKDDATRDLLVIERWWRRAPQANVGIACRASGLVVLDIDPRHGGDDELHNLERAIGALPATPTSHTGGGGLHFLFTSPGERLRAQAGHGIDVKDDGYIVAPPSTHPSGRVYGWDVDSGPQRDLASLPAAWLARVKPSPQPRPERPVSAPDDPLMRIPAAIYVPALIGREPDSRGFLCCPFHSGGQESTPSFKVYSEGWACFACPPQAGAGADHLGGSIYTLASLVGGFQLPLRGDDFKTVRTELLRHFGEGGIR